MAKYTREDIIRIVKEENVEFIRMQFTDIFGQMKNVAITASQIEKAVNNHNTFLYYAYGCWVTSYAMQHVLELTHCVNDRTYNALYVDTDSCYATDWNRQALDQYNKLCAAKLKAAGYKPVEHNGREYIPGVAELDGEYTQFRTVGAKRYCCRKKSGELKLTVSGVPKKRGNS